MSPSPLSASICIATYNGSRHLREQLLAIVPQLLPFDEIVVVDDCSTDSTSSVLDQFTDQRIRKYYNISNLGCVKTFEIAISLARSPVVVLSDQDDLWPPFRLSILRDAVASSPRPLVVCGSFTLLGQRPQITSCSPWLINLIGYVSVFSSIRFTTTYGCCMAFHSSLIPALIPFPSHCISHDKWIAMVSAMLCSFRRIPVVVTYRRLHGQNLTSPSNSLFQLAFRSSRQFLLFLAALHRSILFCLFS